MDHRRCKVETINEMSCNMVDNQLYLICADCNCPILDLSTARQPICSVSDLLLFVRYPFPWNVSLFICTW